MKIKKPKKIISCCQFCGNMDHEESIEYRKCPDLYSISHGIRERCNAILEAAEDEGEMWDKMIEYRAYLEAKELEIRNLRDVAYLGTMPRSTVDDYIKELNRQIFEMLGVDL